MDLLVLWKTVHTQRRSGSAVTTWPALHLIGVVTHVSFGFVLCTLCEGHPTPWGAMLRDNTSCKFTNMHFSVNFIQSDSQCVFLSTHIYIFFTGNLTHHNPAFAWATSIATRIKYRHIILLKAWLFRTCNDDSMMINDHYLLLGIRHKKIQTKFKWVLGNISSRSGSKEIALKLMPLIQFISSQGIKAVILLKSLRSYSQPRIKHSLSNEWEANHLTKPLRPKELTNSPCKHATVTHKQCTDWQWYAVKKRPEVIHFQRKLAISRNISDGDRCWTLCKWAAMMQQLPRTWQDWCNTKVGHKKICTQRNCLEPQTRLNPQYFKNNICVQWLLWVLLNKVSKLLWKSVWWHKDAELFKLFKPVLKTRRQ